MKNLSRNPENFLTFFPKIPKILKSVLGIQKPRKTQEPRFQKPRNQNPGFSGIPDPGGIPGIPELRVWGTPNTPRKYTNPPGGYPPSGTPETPKSRKNALLIGTKTGHIFAGLGLVKRQNLTLLAPRGRGGQKPPKNPQHLP